MKKSDTIETDELYIWVTDFTDDVLKDFYKQFAELERNEFLPFIPIIISSYGGECAVLLAMRDMIKSSSKPVATIAIGKAMSCGASLLAAGTPGYRFAAPDTMIMVHEVSSGAFGKTTDIKASAEMTSALNRKMLENLAKDCDRSPSDFHQKIHDKKNADWFLTAREAKRWGIVDHIAIPRLMMPDIAIGMLKPESYEALFKKAMEAQGKKGRRKP